MTARNRRLLVGSLLFAAVVALYLPTLGHPFVIDDAVYISENPAVTHGAPLAAYFLDPRTTASDPSLRGQVYRPLRTLAYAAVARIAGVRPVAFELSTLLLYALSTVLVYALLVTAVGDEAAPWATALWAVLPAHVEAVVYASALGDQLSLACELLALLLGLWAVTRERRALAWALGSMALLAAALLAKEMAVTEAGLLALLLLAVPAARARPRRALLLVGAHGFTTLGFLALRTAVLHRVGQAPVSVRGAMLALLRAPWMIAQNLRITLAPLGHVPSYVLSTPSITVCAAAWGVTLMLVWWVRRRPEVWLGCAWFAVALVPVLGFVPVLTQLADRFVLVPSIGLALLCGVGLSAVRGSWPRRGSFAGKLAMALAVVMFVAGTLVESRAWASEQALWEKAVAIEPASAQAHANLGTVWLTEGRMADALRELDRAVALGRDDAALHLHRAMALDALGRPAEAEAAVDRALARDPALGRAHAIRGDLLRRSGRLDAAERELTRARALSPHHPSTLLLAGALDLGRGRAAAAARDYAMLEALYPREPRFFYLQAVEELAHGEAARAVTASRTCLALAPGQAQCSGVYGRALVLLGEEPALARQALEVALARLKKGPERAACVAARQRLRTAEAVPAPSPSGER